MSEAPHPDRSGAPLTDREAALAIAERAAELRHQDTTLRESALQEHEFAVRTNVEHAALAQAQLREANERLVVAAVRAQTMTDAAEEASAQISHMATHDFLTGLPNRALLTDRLAQSIPLARRHGKRLALMYLDLDRFKNINDSLGHAVGDRLLQAAAMRLQQCVRQSDTVCRQGGDEFVLLLAEIEGAGDAALTAEKLVETLAEPYDIDGHRLHVTVSIGISLCPDDGDDVESMLRNADTAMYHAKQNGRNHYQLFAPGMNARAVARQSVETALHQGLAQREFVLHYQPKVNLDTGAIIGAEALVRLQRAGLPLFHPTEFIGIAENCGLILPIGRWVLREACRQATEWLHAGLEIGRIAVNVSAVEFQARDFLPGVRAILNDSGLDPRHLELELTESGLMHDTQHTSTVLLALRQLGVHIAIDDFGTGYSSLSYLRHLPVDTLKIDQSFVQDIRHDAGEAVLVAAIIAMGRSLKLRVVAEGIETPHQLAYLRAQSCAEGQGYYFGHPVDAREYTALLGAAGGNAPSANAGNPGR